VVFVATNFTPSADRFRNLLSHGVRILVRDRNLLDSPALGIELASALYSLYANSFQLDHTVGMIGARWVLQAIQSSSDPRAIAQRWAHSLDEFRALRAKYLLYR
jgi:uncharacterized protein YbbC (DUF1343 family)